MVENGENVQNVQVKLDLFFQSQFLGKIKIENQKCQNSCKNVNNSKGGESRNPIFDLRSCSRSHLLTING